VVLDISLKIAQVPVRPSLAITTGSGESAPSSKSEIKPGLTTQPLRPAGATSAPALPALLPLPPAVPLAPPLPPGMATHALAMHAWFAAQGMPQPPQLAALVVVSTQAPAQATVPVGQLEVQVEATQKGLSVPHTMPQPLQFVALEVVSVQTPLHLVAHCCAGAPAVAVAPPPAPGVLPPPALPGVPYSRPSDEQLSASTAGSMSVSAAPTNCARSELRFSRNRFHIRAPNLKSSKARGATPPRRNSACFTLLPL